MPVSLISAPDFDSIVAQARSWMNAVRPYFILTTITKTHRSLISRRTVVDQHDDIHHDSLCTSISVPSDIAFLDINAVIGHRWQ